MVVATLREGLNQGTSSVSKGTVYYTILQCMKSYHLISFSTYLLPLPPWHPLPVAVHHMMKRPENVERQHADWACMPRYVDFLPWPPKIKQQTCNNLMLAMEFLALFSEFPLIVAPAVLGDLETCYVLNFSFSYFKTK